MDIIRRNTDYALRLMVNLAGRHGKGPVSSRVLADQGDVSYPLACKLMQKLNAAGLVQSQMGSKGGFSLGKAPSEITLLDVVEVIQGRISVNSCLLDVDACRWQSSCPVRVKLVKLQEYIEDFFKGVKLDQLLDGTGPERKNKAGTIRKGQR